MTPCTPLLARLRAGLFIVLALATGVASAAEPQPSLAERLQAQRQPIALEGGRLAGPGAESLRRAARESQTVFIGEDHGIAEVAEFSAALFEELAGQGFSALAIENGPAAAQALREALARPDPLKAIAAFERAYPFSTAFYNLRPEAELLQRVAKAAGPGFQLWGFDQELMGAGKLLLAKMAAEPISPAARRQIDAMRRQEAEAYTKAFASGDPTGLYMLTASQSELDTLRRLLSGPRDRRALALLDALQDSRLIYQHSDRSHPDRILLMKRLLAAQMDRAPPQQKLLVKAGAIHAYRGVGPLGVREPGNYLAERAEGQGQRSLHVLAFAPQGRQAVFAGLTQPPQPAEIDRVDPQSPIAGVLPVIAAAEGQAGWSLFDLRPLRLRAKSLSSGQAEVERLLQGFDFVLVVPQGSAAAPL